MKTPPAREFESGHHEAAACRENRILSRLQILRIEDYEWRTSGLRLIRLAFAKSAIQACVHLIEAHVIGSPVLKIPAKNPFIKGLALGDARRCEFNVVDGVVHRQEQ